MKRTIAAPLTALALVAAACTSSPGTSSTDTSPPDSVPTDSSPDVDVTDPDSADGTNPGNGDPGSGSRPLGFAPAALSQFGDCSAFLDYVHTEGAERVGPYGFNGGGGFFGPEVLASDDGAVLRTAATEAPAEEAAEDSADFAASAPAVNQTQADADSSGGDGNFSTTNVQVDGVDEPDIIKTDGERVLAIAGEMLHYIDIDGTTGTKRGSVNLNNQSENSYSFGQEIFINGDRAFVFAQGEVFFNGPFPEPFLVDDVAVTQTVPPPTVLVDDLDAESSFAEDAIQEPIEDPIPTEPFPGPFPGSPDGYFGPTTVVYEVDLSNPDNLQIVNTLSVQGRYISARSIGETARIAVTSPPKNLGFLFPSNPGTEDAATEANRDIIAGTTAEDWIPTYRLNDGDEQQLVSCEGVHAPADFGGFDMLSIVTLDLGESLTGPGQTSTVMATGDTVYASQDRMYVTTNLWQPVIDEQTQEWLDENYQTAVHRFSIAGDTAATYEASGSIEGHLLNQFSMNDRDGVFYAATTKGSPWGANEQSESQIVALEMNGDQLEQIGSVGGLGLGERIFSVRYVGTTAYVVTFRQVDPFYVLDLTDPRNMIVQGELKIPGFSSYLHPITADLVLGVGQDATEEGFTTGTKVSLFNVSNPADPTEVDVWTLPNAFSDAEFDHRAFLYWEPTGTAVLPLQSWSDQFAGAVVLNISADGITEQGRISQADEQTAETGTTDCDVIDASAFGEDNEFFWISQEGGQVQTCGEDDNGGAAGLSCETIPIDQIGNWFGFDEQGQPVTPDIDTTGADRIELCWPNWNGWQYAVQRTLVIDGTLWTLSPTRLQANDISSLDRTAAIDLN